jgi:predicted transglutaminase-like cysteine proteinase
MKRLAVVNWAEPVGSNRARPGEGIVAHRGGLRRVGRSRGIRGAWLGRTGVLPVVAALIAFSFSLCAAGEDAPLIPAATPLQTTLLHVEPVPAWEDFCKRYPVECAVDLFEPAALKLTAATWVLVQAVNEHVNSTIKPMSDFEHRGVLDHWEFPDDGHGDCEDYQLLKRKLLIDAGLPRRAMRITAVLDETRQGHAVLMIRTNRGDYILDNRTTAVLAWNDTAYEYIKREGSEGSTWIALNGERKPVAVVSR